MYKECNIADQINMWIEKCTKKVIYLIKLTINVDREMYKESNLSDQINNMWIDKCTKKVIYLTKLTICG
jgi:predicted ABC-type ATPase